MEEKARKNEKARIWSSRFWQKREEKNKKKSRFFIFRAFSADSNRFLCFAPRAFAKSAVFFKKRGMIVIGLNRKLYIEFDVADDGEDLPLLDALTKLLLLFIELL